MACVLVGVPTQNIERANRHAELVNTPRVGCHSNVYFPTVQVNLNAASDSRVLECSKCLEEVDPDDLSGKLKHSKGMSENTLQQQDILILFSFSLKFPGPDG